MNRLQKAIASIERNPNSFRIIGFLFVVGFACIPLFFTLPFRDNIYLSWEGAYRMYQGQVPFKDFGLPLGYGFWIIPTLFFKLFGPYFSSLIKAQVLINIISGVTFFVILERLVKDAGLKSIALILYVISFSFYNFWPWYNHTVIVFEFISLAMLLTALLKAQLKVHWKYTLLLLSSMFCFLSFFTKQDGGAFALLIGEALLIYYSIVNRNWKYIVTFNLGYAISALLLILPIFRHDFLYWFNLGQEPHSSRIDLFDFLSAILGKSPFIKLYLLLIVLAVLIKSREGFKWLLDQRFSMHLILTLGILFQAAILQVTSYVPADSNIYFHSFMFVFIVANLGEKISFNRLKFYIPLLLVVFFWWTGTYWKYLNRMIKIGKKDHTEVVSYNTYTINKDTTRLNKSSWKVPPQKVFEKIKVPPEVIGAIDSIQTWSDSQASTPKVLNMSEITPLAEIIGYELEKGTPLWFHLNVAFFERELDFFGERIENHYYDLVLFEYIPYLNNFYPFELQRKLDENYELWFSFQAPRELTTEIIYVYRKPKN